jgi:hypothetical protein
MMFHVGTLYNEVIRLSGGMDVYYMLSSWHGRHV